MNSDRFARLRALLLEVADLAAEERRALLDRACADDPTLRADVEALLDHDRAPHEILNSDLRLLDLLGLSSGQGSVNDPETGPVPVLLTGQSISHYQILDLVGEGGMGQVYRARDTRLDREVAFKIIPPTHSTDLERMRRFDQEARAAGALNHPNIVAIHDVGVHGGGSFVVMELLEGESLRQRMRRGPVPVRKAVDYAAQVARGLAAAHEKGIIHRDIKPENLFLTKDGRIKILDFGVAKLTLLPAMLGAKGGGDSLTGPGAIIGTSGYMSPEQARGHPADARSDIFALGATLHELLAGRPAFRKDSIVETLHAIMNEDPVSMSAAGREFPAPLEPIVRRCLEKSPEERFQSARDLAFALEASVGSDVRPGDGLVLPATTALARREPRPRRRGPVLIAVAVVLLLAGLTAVRLLPDHGAVHLDSYRFTPVATSLLTQDYPAWSPDGRTLAFIGQQDAGSGDRVWVQATDDPSPVPLTTVQFEIDTWNAALMWSPDGGAVYCPGQFASHGAGLYRIPVGGGDPEFVRYEARFAFALSPDGRTLAWVDVDSASAPSRSWRVWYATPPTGRRRLYEPVPFEVSNFFDVPTARFSPDGRKLLVFCNAENEGQQLWILPWPPGPGKRIPTRMGDTPIFSWMPDSKNVVLGRWDGGSPGGLWMGSPGTGRFWSILKANNPLPTVSVAPDGRRIAYTSILSQYDVLEVPLDGASPRTILGSQRSEQMPELSPDGKELIFVTDARGQPEVWIRDMATGTDRSLLRADTFSPGARLVTPTLSPDRQRYALDVIEATENGGIRSVMYVGFVRGGLPVRATDSKVGSELAPAWSPDGSRLCYVTSRGIAIGRPGIPGSTLWLSQVSQTVLLEWSPDGAWIAALDSTGRNVELFGPDGRSFRKFPIPADRVPLALAWTHDARILYSVELVIPVSNGRLSRDPSTSRHSAITSIDVATGQRKEVRDLGALTPASVVSPGQRVSVTPDDRALVYAVLDVRSEIWLLEGAQAPRPWYSRIVR